MFDIGFSEIVVIAVVALIVIGPEKLPKTARTLGHLFGRLQRYVNEVKSDINREMELEELRKLQQEVKTAAQDFQTSMTSTAQEVESSVRAVESAAERGRGGGPQHDAPACGTCARDAALAAPPPERAARKPTAPGRAGRQATLPGFDRG
jgi:sec-independent protein translocase protein TatB